MTVEYPIERIRDLVEGKLPLDEILELQREKDEGRFEKVLQIEQERVTWDDRILVPLQEHLYVVEKESGDRIVKCSCGHEYGDYRINWKELALVYERQPDDELYLGPRAADPDWQILREFYCPGCATLLDVEPVPVGYPFVFNFLPDIE
jgi:acetone carboxylase gamma subunit